MRAIGESLMTRLRSSLRSALGVKAFLHAEDGNIVVIFSLTALLLISLVGGTVDVGIASMDRQTIQNAADASALAGAKAANAYVAQNGSGAAQISVATTKATSAVQAVFNSDNPVTAQETTPTVSSSTTINADSSATVVVTVASAFSPYLLPLVGLNTIPLHITATATVTPSNAYYQVIFVVDVSGSMSIGGDAATIATMQSEAGFYESGGSCAFACHDTKDYEGQTASGWCDANPGDYFCLVQGPNYCPYGAGRCGSVYSDTMADKRNLARIWGYKLKIDYVNSAIQDFMTQLTTLNIKYPGRYTVGINTFATTFTQLLQPTNVLSVAQTVANAIDVEPVVPYSGNYGYTYTTNGLQGTLQNLKNVGNGSSPTSMLTYVVFLTDAVEDTPGGIIYGRQSDLSYGTDAPSLPSACTKLKTAGVNMFTIWTPYYNTGDIQYQLLVQPLVPQMPTVMQNCASSSNQYYQANDGPGISTAVNSIFNTILNATNLRVTN